MEVISYGGTSRCPFSDFWPVIGATNAHRFMTCLKMPRSEYPYSVSGLWYGLGSRGHFQLVYKVRTPQIPKLRQFILRGSLPFYPIYKDGSAPLRMCLSYQESYETLNWGNLFHAISPLYFSQRDDFCSKAIHKPMKLWCKTSGCDTSWFKTTIHNENVVVRAHISKILSEAFSKIIHGYAYKP